MVKMGQVVSPKYYTARHSVTAARGLSRAGDYWPGKNACHHRHFFPNIPKVYKKRRQLNWLPSCNI